MMNHPLLQTPEPAAGPTPARTAVPEVTLHAVAQSCDATLLRIARRADELVRASEPRARHLSDRWFWMKAEREVLGSASAHAAYNLLRLYARWTQGSAMPRGQTCGV